MPGSHPGIDIPCERAEVARRVSAPVERLQVVIAKRPLAAVCAEISAIERYKLRPAGASLDRGVPEVNGPAQLTMPGPVQICVRAQDLAAVQCLGGFDGVGSTTFE